MCANTSYCFHKCSNRHLVLKSESEQRAYTSSITQLCSTFLHQKYSEPGICTNTS